MTFESVFNALPPFIAEVEPEWFLLQVLPPLDEKHVSQILKKLRNGFTTSFKGQPKKTFPPAILRGRWRWYPRDPNEMRIENHGTDPYRYLDDVFDNIVTAAESVLHKTRTGLTRRFGDNGKKWTVEDEEYVGPDSVAQWQFSRETFKYRMKSNRTQLLGKAARLIRCDFRRRFRLGVTIENTTTRFWLLSRSGCVVSEPFDFVTDHRYLVCYAASTAFATRAELGYDPSVRYVVANNENRLEFLIRTNGKETWYRDDGKVSILSNPDECYVVGSGGRVWMVRELNDAGVPVGPRVVMKDYWILDGAKTESETQADIFQRAKDARRNRGEPEGEIEKYFLTILHDVPVVVDGTDDTTALFMRTLPPKDGPVTRLCPPQEHNSWVPSRVYCACDECQGEPELHPSRHQIKHRRHRRLIFREVGACVEHLNSLPALFRSLADAVEGLKVLHDAQYVHRDISASNLLLCQTDEGPVCKITDLESAQPQVDLNTETAGTSVFMASETLTESYNFCDITSRTPEFRHNYLHDVEGLCWVALYTLFFTIPVARAGGIPVRTSHQEQFALWLFLFRDWKYGASIRREFLLEDPDLAGRAMEAVPTEYESAINQLAIAARSIHDLYMALEQDDAIERINTPEPYTPIYSKMVECFMEAARAAPKEEVRYITEIREARQRKESEEEVEVLEYDVDSNVPAEAEIQALQVDSVVAGSKRPADTESPSTSAPKAAKRVKKAPQSVTPNVSQSSCGGSHYNLRLRKAK